MKDRTTTPAASVAMWLAESKLPDRVRLNVDNLARSDDVCHVAIMPDVHLGRQVNNGTVAATRHCIYPQVVGSDIGCGFSALSFVGNSGLLNDASQAQAVIRDLYRCVPALKRRGGRLLPESLRANPLSCDSMQKASLRDGAYLVGTLGCGNHFVELQHDDADALWLMVHSGSRSMGQTITEFHLSNASVSSTGLKYLDARTESGKAYWNDMQWAMEYARLNRLAIIAQIAELLDSHFGIAANEDTYIDSPHNFARHEKHSGEEFIVHRKSAISAGKGEQGLIAGSMGAPSFIVRGLGLEESLCSSAHGAGRALSRTEASKKITLDSMERQLSSVHCDKRILSAIRDEAPAAYRDISEVMRAQRSLTRQERRLTPLLNFKYPDNR